jgi:RNA polymerase sigma-70 factor (ECF subfamily)
VIKWASVDSAPANLAETKPRIDTRAEDGAVSAAEGLANGLAFEPGGRLLPEMLGRELWRKAGAELVELSEAEFAEALETIGTKDNFGIESGHRASAKQQEAFWRALRLDELALARACALGREAAWRRFLAQYREPMTRIAMEMTGSAGLGEELAGSLYSELYGVTEREGRRQSPLMRYSGRGSLLGWLRAVLAQRRVNLYRRTNRETALEAIEPAAPEAEQPELERLEDLRAALKTALAAVSAEERFLLSAYYLDMHTLHEMGRVLRVHEATVSRKLKRAAECVRKELLRALVARGLSRRAAEEAMGTDPRDVDVNLRKLLQNPEGRAISYKEGRG